MRRAHADTGVLADYLAGRLPARHAAAVAEHIRGCSDCALEAGAWSAIAQAARHAGVQAEPGGGSLSVLLGRVTSDREAIGRLAGHLTARDEGLSGIRHVAGVVAGQLPLVRRRIWAASVIVLSLGAAIAISRQDAGGVVLALAAPLVAALGVTLIYGPEVDAGAELAAATPTSPRLILTARLALVAGFDLVVTLAASAVLAAFAPTGGLWPVVCGWLGPFTLLCALSLLMSVWRGPSAGALASLAVWSLGVMARADSSGLLSGWQASVLAHLWSTSAGVLAAGGTLAAAALFFAPYRLRLVQP